MENKIYTLSDDNFITLIKTSLNISEVLFKLGMSVKGNSWGYSQVKQRMLSLGLKFSDFRGKDLSSYSKKEKIPDNLLFTENSKHTRAVIRKRIILEKLLPYKCSICGISEWNGKKLSLELDHINGINYDNRLENLRFLCPNCHSLTSTYGSKNSAIRESKIEVPEEVKNLIITTYFKVGTIKKVSKTLNLKLDIVRKVIVECGLCNKIQKYVIQQDINGKELNRFGSIAEACNFIMKNNLIKTKRYKTCRVTFLRNCNKFWLNSYWKIIGCSEYNK